MTLRLPIAMLCLMCCASAEVLDRVAVALDHQAITESAVEEEIRVTAYLNQEPVEITPATKRAAAGRLIEQILVEREMEISRYSLPSEEDVDKMLASVEASHAAPLEQYGLSKEVLRRHLANQVAVLRFIDLRFRPGVAVTDEEVEQYYQQKYGNEPEGQAPELNEVRGKIEETLTEQKVDQALGEWLDQARLQSRIRYVEEAFQ